MRDSFIFYRSFYEAIKDLPRDIQGEIYTAIMEYSLYGNETDNLKPVARSVFTLIKPNIDANIARFNNGCKGGRPKKNKTELKPNDNLTETKRKPNKDVDVDKDKEIKESTNVDEKKDIFSFDLFWEQYHQITRLPKTDLQAAKKKWNALSESERKSAIENIQPYWDSLNDKKYCKKARTYLGDKNFNDEFRKDKPSSSGESDEDFKNRILNELKQQAK